MAVYTVLDRDDIAQFIEPFGIGPLLDFEGVAAGVENSNYFISTDQSAVASELRTAAVGHFVLTVYEFHDRSDLDFYIALTTMLNREGLPVPCPLRDANGVASHTLKGKPAVLVPRIAGQHPQLPTVRQCRELGSTLAHLHLACLGWRQSHAGPRSLDWLRATADRLRPLLGTGDIELLQVLEQFDAATAGVSLPRAVIHGDMFRDNVLFEGDTLTAIIDFNSAGDGFLLLDLAVVVNDWCSRGDGSLDLQRAHPLVAAYCEVRPLSEDENRLWDPFLRLAALRFWVSRTASLLLPQDNLRPGSLVGNKDPLEFRHILQHRLQTRFSSPQ